MAELKGWKDTIVALATPPGVGAIGVIRLSGPAAVEIADRLMPGRKLASAGTHTLHVGWLRHNGADIDEVVVAIYKGPKSYTGEDVVEISGHGSPYILQRILDACLKEGARLARPGEFTMRAFLNGKKDLAQAEAVADLIASESETAHRTALHQMRGGFSAVLSALREQLIRFSALIELELDFATEDVEFADRDELQKLILEIRQVVGELIRSFALGNVIRNGVQVAIIGKPNAGKSTLLNALLNEERAIVSDVAGTTRDTIEEVLNIEGVLFRFIDTAGIREHTADMIEKIGVGRSLEKMRNADIVIYLFDASEQSEADLAESLEWLRESGKHFILAGNKSDHPRSQDLREAWHGHPVCWISARAGTGLEELKSRLVNHVLRDQISPEHTVVTNARHQDALRRVDEALNDVESGLAARIPGDLLALDIRRCLQYLGEITGQITHEDQLDYIFSKFCIGK